MKVIRSLFLDELRDEWERAKADRSTRRRGAMNAFHQKLRSLQFLDPACGCGNFLVLAYRELRLLEVGVVRELAIGGGGQQLLPIVNVDQFHGIELFEWPVRIAEVALWLMDHQMNLQASEVFGQPIDRLPLTTSPHIISGNALRMDWNDVLPNRQCSYVLGNPPYAGKQFRNAEQRVDMEIVWRGVRGAGVLDYVTCWYRKAADYVANTRIGVAFVSTNSIAQGEQVGILWHELFQRYHIKIHFAHRTFAWQSEARGRAHVHVVIIGFGAFDVPVKRIFDYETTAGEPHEIRTTNVSPYLVAGSDVVVVKRTTPISDAPGLSFGNMPNDGGNLLLSEAERQALVTAEPRSAELVRPFVGPDEFLYNVPRYCLWLPNASPATLRACPLVLARIDAVRTHRQQSKRETTNQLAATPAVFGEIRQPDRRYLAIPKTSSESRAYIPMAFLEADTIAGTDLFTAPYATLYHFGVLTSAMHMAWVRTVAGRLKSDYRYSVKLVYNNFPWPTVTDAQRGRVEDAARAVLAAREPHIPPRGMSTLADLYDPLAMPRDLTRAHTELDRAVERCYRLEAFQSDRERVEFLFGLYEQLTAPLLPATPGQRRRRAAVPASQRRYRGRTPGLPSVQK